VALVRTDVSEQHIAEFISSLLQLSDTANVSSSLNISTLMMDATCSSETSVVTKATTHHTTEDGIFLF
jgi:hypothetical protein